MIVQLILKYTPTLPLKVSRNVVEEGNPSNVILTSSTGSLGSAILESLLQSPQISQVYCFIHPEGVNDKPTQNLATTGDPQNALNYKIKLIQVDLAKTRMGLSEDTYASLLVDVDIIIHAAWTVDFNLILQSFEAYHLPVVRALIEFSVNSKRNTRIVFTSSTSFAIDWAAAHAELTVPETTLESSIDVCSTGYKSSKQVAE